MKLSKEKTKEESTMQRWRVGTKRLGRRPSLPTYQSMKLEGGGSKVVLVGRWRHSYGPAGHGGARLRWTTKTTEGGNDWEGIVGCMVLLTRREEV